MKLSQEVDNWCSIPVDRNPKISIAGQLRKKARLCQDRRDHMFLIVRSGDLPDYICTERLLGVMPTDAHYP